MVPYSEKIQDWYVFLGIWCFRPFGSEAAPSGRGLKTDGDDSASTSTMSKKVILGLLQQKSNDLNQCQCKNKVLRQTIRRQREKLSCLKGLRVGTNSLLSLQLVTDLIQLARLALG